LALSLIFWSSRGGFGRREAVIDDRPVVRRRTVVDEDV